MGLIQVDDTESQQESIPPILGIAGVAAGGGLIYFGRKQRG
jgi:LPXTG-motif cell wall-anchored protein